MRAAAAAQPPRRHSGGLSVIGSWSQCSPPGNCSTTHDDARRTDRRCVLRSFATSFAQLALLLLLLHDSTKSHFS